MNLEKSKLNLNSHFQIKKIIGSFVLFSSVMLASIHGFAQDQGQQSDHSLQIIKNELSQCVASCNYGSVRLHEGQTAQFDMYYTVEGAANAQPIILLHGGGLNSNMYGPLSKTLVNQNFQVWKIDTRGHGLSHNPSRFFSYGLLTEDLYAFIQAKKIQKPIVLGYSDGGITSLFFAAKYPQTAKAIIPIAAAPIQRNLDHYMKGMQYFYGAKPKGSDQEWLDSLLRSEKMIQHYSAKHLDGVQLLSDAWLTWVQPLFITEQQLSSIQIPVFMIMGTQDEFFTTDDAQRVVNAIPKARLTLVNDTHIFFRNQPQQFEVTVLNALKQIQ